MNKLTSGVMVLVLIVLGGCASQPAYRAQKTAVMVTLKPSLPTRSIAFILKAAAVIKPKRWTMPC